MREIDKAREIVAALSRPGLALREDGGEIRIRREGSRSVTLPLKIIPGRGPEAAREASPRAFNVFVNAGTRLTAALRDALVDGAVATSTGLLRINTDRYLVDVETEPVLQPPARRGPKLQGKSELVAEALLLDWRDGALPSLDALAHVASGHLGESAAPSIAQAQKVIARLEAEGIVDVDRTRGPKYTRYFGVRRDELLLAWAREYMPGMSRSELYVTARDPRAVIAVLAKAGLAGRWAVSGPAAAQIWRPTLVPDPPIQIWVDDVAADDVRRLGLPSDAAVGNLTVRRLAGRQVPLWFAHHRIHNRIPVVSPARAFVETKAAEGPRFDELADALLEAIA